MEGKQKKLEYRERLDKTLASQALVDKDSIRALVKKQLLHSSSSDIHGYIGNFIEKRSGEVSNFLDMLRSASRNESVPTTHGKPHGDWKLKQDNEDYRVMYREGPQGTPFHTLLVEGYVDGPIDVCISLSWEAALYTKWWPQFTIPPFKILMSKCIQKIRIGEQICLVRMKVPWPVSAREVVVHYFELECFEDDLVIVLLNSVSDSDIIDKLTHGFTNDGIPEAKDVVRIDMVGGFALQKLTSSRSYFRTIATMDMKLDFVPPSLINFVSRQLIGTGFKLYQKTVASIAKGDKYFGKALEDQLYVRIREGLYHENKLKKLPEEEAIEREKPTIIYPKELAAEILQADSPVTPLSNNSATGTPEAGTQGPSQMPPCEIEEEGTKTQLNEIGEDVDHFPTNLSPERRQIIRDKKICMSPEVKHALNILDDAISAVRQGGGLASQAWPGFFSSKQELLESERVAREVGSSSSEDGSNVTNHVNAPKVGNTHTVLDEAAKGSSSPDVRHNIQDSPLREVNHNQIAPTSPHRIGNDLNKSLEKTWSYSQNRITAEAPMLNMSKDFKAATLNVNGIHENIIDGGVKHSQKNKNKNKKRLRFCFFPGHA